ncbi:MULTISPECIES: iron-sulfur cluster repair di-iron protein [unclassified Paenibacillus]|uniref:iron-sulfur cluster repair di-iron protein n=1 Tax=unclassified Paenibacillus TaxID=185978 RepID=UPI00070D7E4B|nr:MULTISPECIES: iron-sulfur cluster repair di-iron protein [unclassified Paenibacillus]KQX48498.1 iron-sulfur cluster repair di-iron protein [Paenibacillus sp. Root444D2]KRE49777.1 iron-sulfur cluster repair di-iron protein [Paenibacillus sp. Soil724D2]
MEVNIQLTDRVGDIVKGFPKTAEVFKEYRIDFCCGGNKSLLQVIRDQKIEEEVLLKSLVEAATSAKSDNLNWSELSASELIDYIIRVHHGYLKTALPHLSEYVQKVARVHGSYHPELLQVHQWYEALKSEMEHHMDKEEREAFPAVIAFEKDPTKEKREELLEILAALEQEHEGSGDLLRQMREITKDYELPEDACTTFQLTYLKLEALEADMFQHIHLENNILFNRV